MNLKQVIFAFILHSSEGKTCRRRDWCWIAQII